MRIVRTLRRPPVEARGAAIALGNFDGVHRGHRAVLSAAMAAARARGTAAAALTFEPHPRRLFRPGDPPFRLTTFRSKAMLLAGLGLDVLFVAHFDRAFSSQPADEFIAHVLVRDLGAAHVVAGYDFVFGHGRGGDAEVLRSAGRTHGFAVTIAEPSTEGGAAFASSAARDHLRAGEPAQAAAILGRFWEVEGRVRRGAGRGRGFGVPTANLRLPPGVLSPRNGVYAVRARIGGDPQWVPGVASIGVPPMFEDVEPRLEVHLFDFDADLYGRAVCVALVEYLRPQERFETADALRAAMTADSDWARRLLADPAYRPGRFAAG